MKGDFTRSTFQRQKHYTSVRMQQGRLQLDSDWNEQADIQNHLRQAQVVDMIGSGSGAPSVNPATGNSTRNSFRLGLVSLNPPPSDEPAGETAEEEANQAKESNSSDLVIIPGHFYANGVLCELELGTEFEIQIKDLEAKQVIVPSLLLDGYKLQVNQWLEVVGADDSASVANSTDDDPILLQGLQIASIDEKRRELTLQGELAELTKDQTTIRLRRLTTYQTQPDYPIPSDSASLSDGDYLAYLDVWERHITVIDDEEIRETALNVPDTTTRTKTVWQLKLRALEQLAENQDTGGEAAQATSTPQAQWETYISDRQSRSALMNACARLCPNGQNGGALRSLENQLYRVEIHQSGKIPQTPVPSSSGQETDSASRNKSSAIATFKWSRNNGSTASEIEHIENNVIRIRKTSEDAWVSSTPGQWLEITSEARELRNEPGVMVPLVRATDRKIEFDESRIINGPLPTDAKTVRRWDYTTDQAPQGAIPVQTAWVELEDGIRVIFDANSRYETGDYWMIPARSGPGDIEWPNNQAVPNPQPVPQPRRGITHQYALLATVSVDAQQFTPDLQDERLVFPPLINCLDRTGGTIEGDLEVQGNLAVTQREEINDGETKTIIGKVSIGPETAEARLHVQAAAGLSDPIVRVDDSGGARRFIIRQNGDVGIGTPDSPTQLEVNGKTRTQDLEVTGSFAANLFQGQTFEIVKNPTTSTAERYGLIRVGENDSPKHVELAVDEATTFAFTSGKVGINSTTLTSQFGVLGNAAIGNTNYLNSDQIPANGLVVQGTVGIGTRAPDPQFKLDVAGGLRVTENTVLATPDANRVLIGVDASPDPNAKLYVKGNVRVDGDIEGTNLTFQSNVIFSRGNQDLKFRTDNTDRMIIASTGNIGIGTAPSAGDQLSVNGDLRVNGVIRGDRLTTSSARIGPAPTDSPSNDARLTVHDGVLRVSRTVGGQDKFVQIGRLARADLEFCNYETNCPGHYFNTAVTVDGDLAVEQDLEVKGNLKGRFEIEEQLKNNLDVEGRIESGDRLVAPQVTASTMSSPNNRDLALQPDNNDGKVLIGSNSAPDEASDAKLYVNGPIFGRRVGSNELVQLSSQTLKQGIAQLSSQEVAELLEQLRPVKFTYRDDATQDLRAGFLAEETPDLLTSQDKQGVRILDVVAVLTRSLQDQQTTVSDLVKVIREQSQEIAALKNKVSELEQPVSRALNLDAPSPVVAPLHSFTALSLDQDNERAVQASLPSQLAFNQPLSEVPPPDFADPPRNSRRTRRRPGWTRWPLIRQIHNFFYWMSNRFSHRRTRRRLQRTRFH